MSRVWSSMGARQRVDGPNAQTDRALFLTSIAGASIADTARLAATRRQVGAIRPPVVKGDSSRVLIARWRDTAFADAT
jgi:hypothetical protein